MVRLATNVTDPVADLLTRIRNANLAAKDELVVPASRMNDALLGILEREGYIGGVKRDAEDVFPVLRVALKYGRNRQRTITNLKRVSRPGRRVYVGSHQIPRVLGGYGVNIVSTSRGLMSGKTARRENVGGELLAEVY